MSHGADTQGPVTRPGKDSSCFGPCPDCGGSRWSLSPLRCADEKCGFVEPSRFTFTGDGLPVKAGEAPQGMNPLPGDLNAASRGAGEKPEWPFPYEWLGPSKMVERMKVDSNG